MPWLLFLLVLSAAAAAAEEALPTFGPLNEILFVEGQAKSALAVTKAKVTTAAAEVAEPLEGTLLDPSEALEPETLLAATTLAAPVPEPPLVDLDSPDVPPADQGPDVPASYDTRIPGRGEVGVVVPSPAAGAFADAEPPAPPPDTPPPPPLVGSSRLEDSATMATVAIGLTMAPGVLAGLYSRFQRHTILRSEARARIHAAVVEEPGRTLAQLCEATGMTRGALVHHVDLLVRHGVLVSRHDGLHRRLYTVGGAPAAATRPPTPAESRLLDALAARGPMTQRDLARLLQVTPQAVSQQVRRLETQGRLHAEETRGVRRWQVAPGEPPAPRPLDMRPPQGVPGAGAR